jgi:hypothetical protein
MWFDFCVDGELKSLFILYLKYNKNNNKKKKKGSRLWIGIGRNKKNLIIKWSVTKAVESIIKKSEMSVWFLIFVFCQMYDDE